MSGQIQDIDGNAYRPARIAELVEEAGVAKAHLPFVQLLCLAVLAGAFIALGGAFYLAVLSGVDDITGPVRLAGGIAFSLGLILVIVGGAELFTGNALMVMALVDRRISFVHLMRNWGIVFLGNAVGAWMILGLCQSAGLVTGDFAEIARKVTEAKFQLSTNAAVARGILCNALVCLAVWLSFSARTAAGKVLVIILPIAGFVVLGLEHSIANLFLLPLGLLAGAEGGVREVLLNLFPVTVGNIIGGAGGVAFFYWVAYGHGGKPA